MMTRALLAVSLAAALLGAGCGRDKTSCRVTSVGSCDPNAEHCGLTIQCGDRDTRELRCTPPAATECQCVNNGVVEKSAQLADGITKESHGIETANAACGWNLH